MGSTILDRILADIKEAMKARDMEKVTALRSVHAQIKDAGTNAGKEETDELVASVLTKAVKQRKDSIEQFRQGDREDLAEKEQREVELLQGYLPEQMPEDEIRELVRSCIAETGAAGKQDIGRVMKALMPKVKGKADGKLVNQIVQGELGE